jgi:putative FmdB family regulatory protein
MPLYEYKCGKCGEVFERIQKFSDEPLHEHPGCGGALEKLVSAAALQFKGSGWYVNDYGKNGSAGKERAKEKASSEGKGSDSKSSDGKSSESGKSETAKPAPAPAAAGTTKAE